MYSAVRSSQDILDHTLSGSWGRTGHNGTQLERHQNDRERYRTYLRRRRNSCVLDRKWIVCRQDISRICNQVLHLRVFRQRFCSRFWLYCDVLEQKRAFARYWDKVEDVRDISGVSRFLAGGMGGITSQLSMSISAVRPFSSSQ